MMKSFIILLIITGSISTYRKKLNRMQRKLYIAKMRVKNLRKKREGVEDELGYLNERESAITALLSVLNEGIEQTTDDIDSLDQEISHMEYKLKKKQNQIKSGLIFLYKISSIKSIPAFYLFLPEKEEERRKILDLNLFIKRTIETQRKLYDRILAEYEDLKSAKDLKNNNLTMLLSMRDEEDIEKLELRKVKQQKRTYLKNLKGNEAVESKKVRKLVSAIKKMESLIARLEAEREARRKRIGQSAVKPTGNYPWPLVGRVVSYYGTVWHPAYKTRVKNNGIDIKGDYNAPVKTIEKGEVIYADNFMGYGNTVIIDHGGFLSVYAQLGGISVKKGGHVYRGEVIGVTGNRFSNFGSILHFEIRIHGKAVNPLHYLGRK